MQQAKTIVVALGGNALQRQGEATAAQQQAVARQTARQLVQLLIDGNRLVIVHGNGPQVGNIILHEEAINTADVPSMPVDSCGAMSQGLIGYWLQQAFLNELQHTSLVRSTVSMVVQTEVDASDPAFQNPTKPIGPFYTQAEAEVQAGERGFTVKEDAGRGWRRVVPSPKPRRIVEIEAIKTLVASNVLVVAAGGGGVPIVSDGGSYHGVEAVIDKDFSAAQLAHELKADMLAILTAVDSVKVGFNTPQERALSHTTAQELADLAQAGHFAKGSMLPKVEAVLEFVTRRSGRQAVITSLENASRIMDDTVGTRVTS